MGRDPDREQDELEDSIDLTDEEVAALADEAQALHNQDFKQHGQNLLDENVGMAILQLTKLARSASTERVRLEASRYIVERVLGPLAKIEPSRDLEKDPVYKFLKKVGAVN